MAAYRAQGFALRSSPALRGLVDADARQAQLAIRDRQTRGTPLAMFQTFSAPVRSRRCSGAHQAAARRAGQRRPAGAAASARRRASGRVRGAVLGAAALAHRVYGQRGMAAVARRHAAVLVDGRYTVQVARRVRRRRIRFPGHRAHSSRAVAQGETQSRRCGRVRSLAAHRVGNCPSARRAGARRHRAQADAAQSRRLGVGQGSPCAAGWSRVKRTR